MNRQTFYSELICTSDWTEEFSTYIARKIQSGREIDLFSNDTQSPNLEESIFQKAADMLLLQLG